MTSETQEPTIQYGAGEEFMTLQEVLQHSNTHAEVLFTRSTEVIEAFEVLEALRNDPTEHALKEDALTDILASATETYADAVGNYAHDRCLIIDKFHSSPDSPLPEKIRQIGVVIGREMLLREHLDQTPESETPDSQDGIYLRLAQAMEEHRELQELGLDVDPYGDEGLEERLEHECIETLAKLYAELKAQDLTASDNAILHEATARIVERQVVEDHYLMRPPTIIEEEIDEDLPELDSDDDLYFEAA